MRDLLTGVPQNNRPAGYPSVIRMVDAVHCALECGLGRVPDCMVPPTERMECFIAHAFSLVTALPNLAASPSHLAPTSAADGVLAPSNDESSKAYTAAKKSCNAHNRMWNILVNSGHTLP